MYMESPKVELTSQEESEFVEGLGYAIAALLPDIPALMIHNHEFELHLKDELFATFEGSMDYEQYSIYYDKSVEPLFLREKIIKRCFRHINDQFDHWNDNKKQIHILKNIPQPAQKTDEWYTFRKQHLTGSNIWKVFGTDSSVRQLIYEKLVPDHSGSSSNSSLGDTPLNWGHKYEPLTNALYEYYNDVTVEEFGCIPHSTIPFLAASPDGIVTSDKNNGRMVEIKNVVSREITQIPKMEYYIQMQLQMEVCDLDECDFVETKFIEYDSVGEFEKDKYKVEKGMIMVLVKDNNTLLYEYAPLFQNRRSSLDEFIQSVYDKYHINTDTMENNDGVRWFRNVYWKLEIFSCVYVPRSKEWFQEALPKMQECWDTIEKERNEENAYLKYKPRSNKPRDPKSSDQKTNKVLINLND